MKKSPIPREAIDQNAIVLGKTRSGKSSAMRLIVESNTLAEHKPACIIDPKGDWWGLKLGADGKSAGFPVIIFGGEHADIPINAHAGAHIAELITSGNRPCIIDLGGWMVAERTRFFIDFASTLFRHVRSGLYLVIDECHNFAPKGKLFDPEAAKMLHWANRLASEGLGKGLMLLSASQRPQKVHNDYLTSHETLIAKRVIHKADRDALKDWIDGCGDPAIGKQMIASIADLDRSEAWAWSPEIGFGPEKVTFPFFSTYDSFKPQGAGVVEKLKGWASVDLDEVRGKLTAVVEESKANDPKALKAENAKLSAELVKLRKSASSPSNETAKSNEADLKAARAEGEVRGHALGFAAAMKVVSPLARKIEAHVRGAHERAEEAVKAFDALWAAQGATPALPIAVSAPKMQFAAREVANPAPRAPRSNGHDTDLPAPHRRVLAAISFWASVGHSAPTREQVAGVAGYSPGSGGFNNILGGLATSGMIVKPMAGRVALGEEAPQIDMTPEEAREKLLSVLTGPERKIVDALGGDTSPVTRDEVAKRTDYSAGSGGFNNLLGHLCTLTVLEKPNAGYVALSGWAAQVLA